ncbi:8412_t:CDS:2, partial [Racocetra fulgida]
ELPANLFYSRWKKDPSEETIINNYIAFSTSTSQQSILSSIESSNDPNYQYMLTRLLQKVQRFTTQNPTIATTLYNSFNEIFVSEIEKVNKSQSNNLKTTPTIKNPLIIRGKGRPSNKRITSAIELAKLLNELQNSNIMTILSHQDSNSLVEHFIEANFSSDELSLGTYTMLYCGETLPNPLPLKVSEYLDDIATNKIEQYEFCRVHRGEGIIIPYGIEKGYPLHINFTELPNRRIQEVGVSKADSSLLQINYFESFQPGYYGTKGLGIILKTLTEIFVQTKILTTNLCTPQSTTKYLAQVLVPETAIRLIAEDF